MDEGPGAPNVCWTWYWGSGGRTLLPTAPPIGAPMGVPMGAPIGAPIGPPIGAPMGAPESPGLLGLPDEAI